MPPLPPAPEPPIAGIIAGIITCCGPPPDDSGMADTLPAFIGIDTPPPIMGMPPAFCMPPLFIICGPPEMNKRRKSKHENAARL